MRIRFGPIAVPRVKEVKEVKEVKAL